MRSSLSVVLPNYNHAEFLPGAINGLLSQGRLADEVIVIDDGSTDGSAEVIAQLGRTEPSIRPVLFPQNRGVVACMNDGLSLAAGRYIYFCSADDRIHSHFFELAIKCLDDNPEAAMFCAEMQLFESSGKKAGVRPIARPSQCGKYFSPQQARRLLRGNDQFVATTTAVFRREFLVQHRGFQESLGAMADTFCARDLALRHGFCFAPVIVADYRISSQGLSRTTIQNTDAVLELVSSGRAVIKNSALYPKNYERLFERRTRFAACRLALAEAVDPAPLVLEVGASTSFDREVLQLCLKNNSNWGRLIALVWLTLRLRPYSLFQLGRTAVRRELDGHLRALLQKARGSSQPTRPLL